MKTHINNNKNIKKIITFYLYNIIILSASIAECCEKNDLNIILHNKSNEKLPNINDMNILLSYISSTATNQQLDRQINAPPKKENFKSATSAFTLVNKREINPDQAQIKLDNNKQISYEKKSLELPEDKQPLNKINCDKYPSKTWKFNNVIYMPIHRKNQQPIRIIDKNNKKLVIKKYSKLNFSEINTNEKYCQIVTKLPKGKETEIRIICDKCSSYRTGLLKDTWLNMIRHRKKTHLICKCGKQYKSFVQLKDCNCKDNVYFSLKTK